jgi:ribosomal protein S18 acetylase RimI-like enzyme
MIMQFNIRPATLQDAEAIGIVHANSWKSTYRGVVHDSFLEKQDPKRRANEAVTRLKDPSVTSYVAEINGKVVGFTDFGKSKNAEIADGQLYAIYVLETNQGFGIGKALFERCMELSKKYGFKSIFVSVLANNLKAISFYKKAGGRIVGHDHVLIEGFEYETDSFLWEI